MASLAVMTLGCSGGAGPSEIPTTGGGDPDAIVDGYAVTLRAGSVSVGSGVDGLALIATVRDAAGVGPSWDWDATLLTPTGPAPFGNFVYRASGAGSYEAYTWPGIQFVVPTDYELLIGPDLPSRVTVSFSVTPGSTLGVPSPQLAPDGQSVVWSPIPDAVAYRCIVTPIGGYPVVTIATATSCSLAGVAAGSYLVQVQALSVDLAALGASASRVPYLPTTFDISEGRLGVLVPTGGGTRLQMKAAGGEVRLGSMEYMAIWVSITSADGTPTDSTWQLVHYPWGGGVSGTGWSSYPAGAAQALTIGDYYAYSATPGDYLLWGTSGGSEIFALFTIGAPAHLAEPTDVIATGGALGGATVSWSPVAGAQSYLVRAYWYGSEVASAWTTSTSWEFPSGTFTSGNAYSVYVLATDADLVNGGETTQAGATETFAGTSFTSP